MPDETHIFFKPSDTSIHRIKALTNKCLKIAELREDFNQQRRRDISLWLLGVIFWRIVTLGSYFLKSVDSWELLFEELELEKGKRVYGVAANVNYKWSFLYFFLFLFFFSFKFSYVDLLEGEKLWGLNLDTHAVILILVLFYFLIRLILKIVPFFFSYILCRFT